MALVYTVGNWYGKVNSSDTGKPFLAYRSRHRCVMSACGSLPWGQYSLHAMQLVQLPRTLFDAWLSMIFEISCFAVDSGNSTTGHFEKHTPHWLQLAASKVALKKSSALSGTSTLTFPLLDFKPKWPIVSSVAPVIEQYFLARGYILRGLENNAFSRIVKRVFDVGIRGVINELYVIQCNSVS